ncbi:MAG: hypothetical protein ACK4XK_13630, partial [Casimicrobiaceae bacterium]
MTKHRCFVAPDKSSGAMDSHQLSPSEVREYSPCLRRLALAFCALVLSAAAVHAQVFVSSEKDDVIYRFNAQG